MKRFLTLGMTGLAAAVLAGCVQSLNPFYTDDAKVTMPGINGAWTMLDDHGVPRKQKAWVFGDDEIVTYSDKGGSGTLDVVYFKVGDTTFMDTTAHSPDETVVSEWWTIHVSPVHLLCRIGTNDNRLILRPLNFDWLKEALSSNEVSLAVVTEKGDPALFYASPGDWMQFLKRYGTNDEAFPASGEYVFTRPPASP